jgi:hypothetical protein
MSKEHAATSAAKARREAAKRATAIEAQRRAKLKAALWDADGATPHNVLADFAPFSKYDRNGLDVELIFTAPGHASWTEALATFVFDLAKSNMQALYEAAPEWGWKDARKRAELLDTDARYVIARSRADGQPLAYVHFRFLLEGEFDVLYVYELQTAPAAQRKGLGKFLMQLMELIARKNGMQWCVMP